MSDPRKDIAHVWSNLSTWEGETGTQVVFVAAQMVPSRDHSHIRGSRQNNYLSSLFGNFELAQNGARLVIFGKFQMKRNSVQLFCEPAKVQTKCRNPAVSVCSVIMAWCHSCRDETDHPRYAAGDAPSGRAAAQGREGHSRFLPTNPYLIPHSNQGRLQNFTCQ